MFENFLSRSFITQKPLSQLVRQPQPPPCPAKCSCGNRSLCLKKDITYDIHCNLCESNDSYVGESFRTFNRRMVEHSTQRQSHVFQHFHRHHPNIPILPNITTGIVAAGFADANHRRAYESNLIRTTKPPINIQLARPWFHFEQCLFACANSFHVPPKGYARSAARIKVFLYQRLLWYFQYIYIYIYVWLAVKPRFYRVLPQR